VWDAKLQIIWLAAGLAMGTFFVYGAARDDAGNFDFEGFLFMEVMLLVIITVLFYIYSRQKR